MRKAQLTTWELKESFHSHVASHEEGVKYYTDGSKTEKGVGYSYWTGEYTVANRIDDNASNYTAELYAIKDSVEHFAVNQNGREIVVCTDSRAAIMGIEEMYSRNPLIQSIQQLCVNGIALKLCWTPSHVGIELNERVDRAAREVIDSHMTYQQIPRSDYKIMSKNKITNKWAETWRELQDNKLKYVKPQFSPFRNTNFRNRYWEITVARLRIGHTYLTHHHLMEGRPPPICDNCRVQLSVRHILEECPVYRETRDRIFGRNANLRYMLSDESVNFNGRLYKFLDEINIRHKFV